MTWTDERIAELQRLFDEGLSAGKIAKQMGDLTRNAVIGKVGRLGLERPEAMNQANRVRAAKGRQVPWSPTRERKERAEEIVQKAARARPQLHGTKRRAPQAGPDAALPELRLTDPVAFLDLEHHHCRWPLWQSRSEPRVFCAAPIVTGTSWCAACADKVFMPYERSHRAMGRTLARGLAA